MTGEQKAETCKHREGPKELRSGCNCAKAKVTTIFWCSKRGIPKLDPRKHCTFCKAYERK